MPHPAHLSFLSRAARVIAVLAASSATAWKLPAQQASEEEPEAGLRLEASIGVTNGLPGLPGPWGGLGGVHVGLPSRSRTRLILDGTYVRVPAGGPCCGVDLTAPRGAEAVVLGVGLGVRMMESFSESVALEIQQNSMWFRSTGGTTGASRPWDRTFSVASLGVVWRRDVSDWRTVRFGARTSLWLGALPRGAVPKPTFALTAGIGWR